MSPLILFGSYAVVLFVAMYLLVYIPNKKKQRKMQKLHESLSPGDVIVTMGGIVGTIVRKDGEYVTICIDEEKQVNMQIVVYAVSQIKEKKI